MLKKFNLFQVLNGLSLTQGSYNSNCSYGFYGDNCDGKYLNNVYTNFFLIILKFLIKIKNVE